MTEQYSINDKLNYRGITSEVNLTNERNAIIEYLSDKWDIKTKKDASLNQTIDFLLQQGIAHGINHRETQVEKIYSHLDEIAKIRGKQTTNFQKTYPNMTTIFSYAMVGVMNSVRENLLVSANPKNYATYKKERKNKDVPQEPESFPEFKGQKLHESFAAYGDSFQYSLWIEHVFHDDTEQDRSPEYSLAGAIFRQGISIGYDIVEKKYGTDIEIDKRRD